LSEDILFELNIDHIRKVFNKYTKKAFQALPNMEKPRILDIGCGSGVPTIQLAKLCDGEIIGMDNDQSLLDELDRKIKDEGLSDRVKAIKGSLFEMDFPNESFDIIWAEGSIALIGFKKGLKEWKRLLKPKGFLVVHDDNKRLPNKLKTIPNCGYSLIKYFSLPDDAWWMDYYQPLGVRLDELRKKYKEKPKALKNLDIYQKEVNMVKKNPKAFGSVYFIMQKEK